MPAFITFGRVLFAVLFIVSGAFKLLDIAGTTLMITDKVVVPGLLTPYTTQLEGMSGMPMAQMLAIAAGAVELICGLMIALNFGARFFAIVLIIFVIAATFYYHDFWKSDRRRPEEQHDPRPEESLDHRCAVHYCGDRSRAEGQRTELYRRLGREMHEQTGLDRSFISDVAGPSNEALAAVNYEILSGQGFVVLQE